MTLAKAPSPSPTSVRVSVATRIQVPAARAVRCSASRFSSARGTMRSVGGQKPSWSSPSSGVQLMVP